MMKFFRFIKKPGIFNLQQNSKKENSIFFRVCINDGKCLGQ